MGERIFVFDYEKSINHVRPLIGKAESKQYAQVIEYAQKLVREIGDDEWILEGAGTTLRGFTALNPENIEGVGELPHQTGFAFLVIFSQFLELLPDRFTNFGSGNVGIVEEYLGWSETDCHLLRFGMSYTTLLGFPEMDISKTSETEWHNPAFYRLWLRPENCFHSAWWNVETVKHLHKLLSSTPVDFSKINLTKLKLKSKLHPSVTEVSLREDYHLLTALLSYAADYGKSVYFVSW